MARLTTSAGCSVDQSQRSLPQANNVGGGESEDIQGHKKSGERSLERKNLEKESRRIAGRPDLQRPHTTGSRGGASTTKTDVFSTWISVGRSSACCHLATSHLITREIPSEPYLRKWKMNKSGTALPDKKAKIQARGPRR